jgi:hypothetical protein
MEEIPKPRNSIRREDNFNPKTGNNSLHEIINYNGVRVLNFATSKNVIVKSTTYLHPDIHKFTWTSPEGKTRHQIDHTLTDRRRHSIVRVLDIQTSRGADCDNIRKTKVMSLQHAVRTRTLETYIEE